MNDMSYKLIKSSRFLKKILDDRLLEYNVTASQFSVLNQIAFRNNEITAAEIADILESDRPTISGVVNRLEKNGLVIKKDNPDDRRSAYLKLDKQSIELVKELRMVSNELTKDVFRIFDETELRNIDNYLNRLQKRLDDLTQNKGED